MAKIANVATAVAVVCAMFGTSAAARAQDRLSGLYIGAFVGGAYLDTTLVTPAITHRQTTEVDISVPTPQGTVLVRRSVPVSVTFPSQRIKDQGGNGVVFGARFGYGTILWDRIYVGAEAEVTFPQMAESSRELFGQTYRGTLNTEAALFVRAGYTLNGQTLFYGRAGVAVPRQRVEVGSTTVERWFPTPAVGVGVEHALTPKIALRMDLTMYPAVEDNQIGSYRGVVGVSYRF